MEPRNCGTTNSIQAIRDGSVIRVCNRDSKGKPALSCNTLEDVYKGKDSKVLQQSPKISSHNMQSGSVFDPKHVKLEASCSPSLDRTFRKIKSEADEFVEHSDNRSDSVLDDDTTLKHLKTRFKGKERKLSRGHENCEVPCLPVADETKPEADEFVQHSDKVSDSVLDDDTSLRKLKRRLFAKRRKLGYCYENSEVPCFPMVDSTLLEIKPEQGDFIWHSDAALEDDLDDETTLRHLKERFLEKKRNSFCSIENSNLACTNEKPVEDESKPKEFWGTTNLKLKYSRKSRGKGKCMKGSSVSSSTTAFDIKSEPDLVSEWSPQVGGDLAPVIQVKVEAWDAEELGCQKSPIFSDDSSISHQQSLVSAEECLNCVTNEISYDHLLDAKPATEFIASNSTSVNSETSELHCDEFLDLPPLGIHKGKKIKEEHSCRSSPSDDQNPDVCMLSRYSSSVEEVSAENSSSVVQVPDMAIDSTTGCIGIYPELSFSERESEADFPLEQGDSLIIPSKNHSSSRNFVSSLKHVDNAIPIGDTTTYEEEPLTGTLIDIARSGLNCGSNMDSTSPITDAEIEFSLKYQMFSSADTISTPELHQPPERLLSTRKVVPPSSQEQMCFAEINSGNENIKQIKVFISSNSIIKKPRSVRVNTGKPHFTRALPNLRTGNMPIQGFPESAVAFSQRQMQDIESLAVKMMKELKSMKDIVEQKLLFEAYRNVSLRSYADEVKSAVDSATKMEETAQRWLSKMSKDCHRFCKIMKLTPNEVTAAKDAVPRERRKIMFADEAGGKLCHVKFFEEDTTSAESDGVKQ